jgi:O-antigen ligase
LSTFDESFAAPMFHRQKAAMGVVGSLLVFVGVLLSGFVISEPAPYELFMAFIVTMWFLFGLKISRQTAPLLALLLIFNIGGIMSMTQMKDLDTAPMYLAVSTFLALTAVFFAAIIEERHQRLDLIFRAWVVAAVATALLGILGYFNAFPGSDVFTLYSRAKGAFQDPNVFGPFLIAPVLYLIHGILTKSLFRMPLNVLGIIILSLGVLLSFSRAAWGLFGFAVLALVFIMLLKERSGAFRLKILVLALVGLAVLAAVFMIALQYQQVSDLFFSRAKLVESYDGGHLGRFDRHRLGFAMMLERPLGIGPLVFSKIFPEDEHNIWLKCLTTYGWLGFCCYVGLVLWTIASGFKLLLRDRPWQPFLMIGWIMVVGHVGIGNIIDIDHWRHAYLLFGIVWGCRALEYRYQRNLRNNPSAVLR